MLFPKVSPREKEVLHLIAYEHNTKQIAETLYISQHTVQSHRKNLLWKLDVKNTAGLIRKAFQLRIICSICILSISVIPFWAQDLEITGKARVTTMDKDNTADSIVVRQSDGTLAVREVFTLSEDIPPRIPVLVGSLGIGGAPRSVQVSGRYVFVVDGDSGDLKVIDVSDPANPAMMSSLSIGIDPRSVYVSGRYAYVVENGSDDLKVIDISDPANPTIVGSLGIGVLPCSVYVSGPYAYVLNVISNDLKVVDVSDPASPALAGSLGLGGNPKSVFVSGRYVYVVDAFSDDLKVIDVSDPASPALTGSLGIGMDPTSVYVSGRYVYVVDQNSDDLKVIDVSDPASPALVGSLGIGSTPKSVYVSGRYVYVVDLGSADLKVIDVSDPASPTLVGSLGIGSSPQSLYVSGRYAYVVDAFSDDLKVIDVSGVEAPAVIAHSLEAGNLQVRNDIIAQGQLQVTGGINVGAGGIFSDGNVGIAGDVDIVTPGTSAAEGILVKGDTSTNRVTLTLDNRDTGGRSYSVNSSGGNAGAGKGKWFVRDENTGSNRLVIDSSGNIGIAANNPSQNLDVNGNARFRNVGSGSFNSNLNIAANGVLTTSTSDRRLKENINELKDPLEKILALRSVSFNWKKDETKEKRIGLIAQEVEQVVPELVFTNDVDGYKGVHYQEITALLTEAIKELTDYVKKQQVQLDQLLHSKDQKDSASQISRDK